MKHSNLVIQLITILLVFACVGVALYYRVALPYDKIFTSDWTKFSGTDSYLFMRMVDNIIHNYPNVINFDPYSLYPGGFPIFTPPFFPFLVATSVLAASFGSPSQSMIDTVGVYVPAVLGALTVVPVFFIAKYIFNKWAGVIAAAIIAILPGEFLGRSILGFTDQHVAETFFSSTAVLFFILALRTASTCPNMILAWRENRRSVYKLLTFGILSGIFLGLYLITWYGALLFVMIFFIFIIVQQIVNHFSRVPMSALTFAGSLTFLVALVIFILTSQSTLIILPLLIGLMVPVVLNVLSVALCKYNIKTWIFLLFIIGVGVVAGVCFYIISPIMFQQIVDNFKVIFIWSIDSTILEKQPILFPGNVFSFDAVWGNFTTGIFLSLAAIGFLLYHNLKRKEQNINFIIIWSLIILAATLSQRRFAYYFVVNVAVLSGYICWLMFDRLTFKKNRLIWALLWGAFAFIIVLIGLARGFLAIYPDFVFALLIAIVIGLGVYYLNRLPEQQVLKAVARSKKQARKIVTDEGRRGAPSGRRINPVIAIAVIFSICLVAIAPNRVIAEATARSVFFAPTNAWCESLTWLNKNTPEPFNNQDYYYEYYKAPAPGEIYKYPLSAYSIASWWDYGYWIARIGHRIPVSNPGTNHNGEAYFFMAKDEKTAAEIINRWNSKYVIINSDMTAVQSKLHALAFLSGGNIFDYIEVFYTEKNGKLEPQIMYNPAYFQTMVVRLYNFGGESVTPGESMVVTYVQRKTQDGQSFKQITGSKSFASYVAAQTYLAGLKTGELAGIFSSSAFSSPIPLEKLNNYKVVHDSNNKISLEQRISWPEIRIFEYSR